VEASPYQGIALAMPQALRRECALRRCFGCWSFTTGGQKHDVEVIEDSAAVRLSRDKVNQLAHSVTDAVANMDEVEFIEDRNTIRLEVRKILEELFLQEARIDQSARQKIESQRRTIIEGTEEWSILYRKYYNDEVKKLGV
jgi:hypothetical protein